nr:MAG TPA: hypothetical protein [Caudoviricetes sp.]
MYFRGLRAECFCFFMSLGSVDCQVFFYAQIKNFSFIN